PGFFRRRPRSYGGEPCFCGAYQPCAPCIRYPPPQRSRAVSPATPAATMGGMCRFEDMAPFYPPSNERNRVRALRLGKRALTPNAMDVEKLRADTPGCAKRVHLNNAGAALP